jgi:hypothetical protein
MVGIQNGKVDTTGIINGVLGITAINKKGDFGSPFFMLLFFIYKI